MPETESSHDDVVACVAIAAANKQLEAGHVVSDVDLQVNAADTELTADGAVAGDVVRGVEVQLAEIVAPR